MLLKNIFSNCHVSDKKVISLLNKLSYICPNSIGMKPSILLVFVLIVCASSAQKIDDISLKHTTKQNGLSMQFKVLDSDKKGVRHYDENKLYYWHKAQLVISTQGGSSGQLLHGLFESFYSTKQLCEKGNYSKGLKDGEWDFWRQDGTLIKTEHWVNGVQKGTQVSYSEQGKIQKRTIIRGNRSITENGDTLIEIKKNSKKITLSDSTGQLISVSNYKDNLLHGKQVSYTSDGSVTEKEFKDGIEVVQTQSDKTDKKTSKEKSKETKVDSSTGKTADGTQKEGVIFKTKQFFGKIFSKKDKTKKTKTEKTKTEKKKTSEAKTESKKPSEKKSKTKESKSTP